MAIAARVTRFRARSTSKSIPQRCNGSWETLFIGIRAQPDRGIMGAGLIGEDLCRRGIVLWRRDREQIALEPPAGPSTLTGRKRY
jgi:hypothetical protein